MKVAYFVFIGVVLVGAIWLLDYATSDALAWVSTDEMGRPLSEARRVIAVYLPFALGVALILIAAMRIIFTAKPDARRRAWAYVLPVSVLGIAALGAAAFRANTRLAHSVFPPNKLPIATSAAFDEEQWHLAEHYVRYYYHRPAGTSSVFVPYDPWVLKRVTFRGLTQAQVEVLLQRGGRLSQRSLSPFGVIRYAMIPSPRCMEFTLTFQLGYRGSDIVVVSEEVKASRTSACIE